MDALPEFLNDLKQQGLARGNLLGLFHLLIGRRITRPDGAVVTAGLAWRDLAVQFKRVRWDKEAVTELGINPADLPPRDREKYWYTAIARSRVSSAEAIAAGENLAEVLRQKGYTVSSAPGK